MFIDNGFKAVGEIFLIIDGEAFGFSSAEPEVMIVVEIA